MSDKFKGKYRNGSARLPSWDYGSDGAYFITICTKDREHHFGKVENGKMHYSPAGALAYAFWDEIRNHAKNLVLGEFVVMPNHIHGILILDGNNDAAHGTDIAVDNGIIDGDGGNGDGGNGDGDGISGHGRNVACNVPTKPTDPSEPSKNKQMADISPKPNSISTIIRSYKSAVTKYCNRMDLPIGWQPRFHDSIIRNDRAFKKISQYIMNNPKNWKDDEFFR